MSMLAPGPLGYSWAEIADLLGVTRTSAWQRFVTRETQAAAQGDRSGSEPPMA